MFRKAVSMFSTKKQQQFLAWNKLWGGGGVVVKKPPLFRKAVFMCDQQKKKKKKKIHFLAWYNGWGPRYPGQDILVPTLLYTVKTIKHHKLEDYCCPMFRKAVFICFRHFPPTLWLGIGGGGQDTPAGVS